MATTAGFKQQCPSCEAMVPIKDAKLIGKKIDCPKCKYRFVVEEPAAEDKPDDGAITTEAKDKPGSKVKVKRPVNGKAAVKGAATAPKVGGAEAGKKEGKGSSSLKLGLALAAVALVVLGVGGWIIFGPKGNTPKKVGPGPVVRGPNGDESNTEDPDGKNKKKDEDKKNADNTAPGDKKLFELLPAHTERILYVRDLPKLTEEGRTLGHGLYQGAGAFRGDSLEGQLGFKVADVSRLLHAEGKDGDKDWSLTVVRTGVAMKPEALLKSLGVDPTKEPARRPNGKAYYLVQPNDLLKGLASLVRGRAEPTPAAAAEPPPVALFWYDENKTLVAGDRALVEQVLDEGKPRRPEGATGEKGLPKLKEMLEETLGCNKALVSVAGEGANRELFWRVERALGWDLSVFLPYDKDALKDLVRSGLSVQPVKDDHLTVQVGLEYAGSEQAGKAKESLEKTSVPAVAFRILRDLGIEVTDPEKEKQERERKEREKAGSSPDGGERGRGGEPGLPVQPKKEETPKPVTALTVKQENTEVVFTIDLVLDKDKKQDARLKALLQSAVLRAKGLADMASGRPRLHDLADAVAAYVADKQKSAKPEDRKFPRSALPRPPTDGVPVPPKDRLSWLVELLPYLPDGRFQAYRQEGPESWEDMKKGSWQDGDGWLLAQTLVPEFLVHTDAGEYTWWTPYMGKPVPLPTTHWVGIAGVGLDVADVASTKDPEVAKKFGIFGHERETKFDDLKGGLGKTVLMVRVPYDPKAKSQAHVYRIPWAVGGATVRGVPEKDSLEPFLTVHDGKEGVLAVMADGTVRFLAKGAVTDEQFQALCTVQGDKPGDEEFEKIAPKVYSPHDKKSELKAEPGQEDKKPAPEKSGETKPKDKEDKPEKP